MGGWFVREVEDANEILDGLSLGWIDVRARTVALLRSACDAMVLLSTVSLRESRQEWDFHSRVVVVNVGRVYRNQQLLRCSGALLRFRLSVLGVMVASAYHFTW